MTPSRDHKFAIARQSGNSGSPHVLALLALLGANTLLAFGPVFVRQADVGPVAAGFWRLTLAVPPLALAAVFVRGGSPLRIDRTMAAALVIGGLAFAADLAAWHLGILRTLLANATLFGNSAVLFYPVYGFLVARSWPNAGQATALVLAVVGAMLMMGQSAELSARHLTGDLLCLLAGLLYTVYFAAMAHARTRLGPVAALALATIAGTLPLLVAALAMGERVMPHDWTPLIALALASQVLGQGLMIYAIGQLTPMVMGIGLLIQPVIGAAIGWCWYGERLGPVDLLGGALVAVALVLVRGERRAPLAPDAGAGA